MESLNFELLRTYAPDLADQGRFAESYVFTDPASTVVKLRIIAEQLVLHVYDGLSITLPPRPKLCELIEDVTFQRVVPRAICYKIDAVRIHGNHGAHGDQVSIGTALCMLRETYRIACWFFLAYIRGSKSTCPGFREPSPPPGIEWPPSPPPQPKEEEEIPTGEIKMPSVLFSIACEETPEAPVDVASMEGRISLRHAIRDVDGFVARLRSRLAARKALRC